MASAFLTAEWRDLVMLNYEIDPATLAPRVPSGTALDLWNGRALVSIVGFRFLDTRVMGIPIPFHRNFDEVNLRFYVRRHAPDGVRRGVVFIREIVPRAAIKWIARAVYNENYVALPMRHDVGPGQAIYAWRTGDRWNELRAETEGRPVLAEPGSEEEFITEHYWGYARQRDGSTLEYQVEHPRWRVWQPSSASLACDVARLYGREFLPYLNGKPSSAFVADGSPIVVHRGSRIG